MTWDEGKPMPQSATAKKSLARQMMGGKAIPGADESTQVPLEGSFKRARIDPAANGFSLNIDRELKNISESPTGATNAHDSPPNTTIREYNTVHMQPQHLMTELNRHLIKGQVGSNTSDN